jgi:diguanylate cyclase (GGDEF)-like protein
MALTAFSAVVTVALAGVWMARRRVEAALEREASHAGALRRLAAGEPACGILKDLCRDFELEFPANAVRVVLAEALPPAGNSRRWMSMPVEAKGVRLGEIQIAGPVATPHQARELGALAGLAAAVLNQARLTDELRRQASTDRLTGLANRSHFAESFPRMIDAAAASKSSLAVFCIDADRFKHINDGYGHQAGDTVLCEIARRLRAAYPQSALLARMGGDEFAAVVPNMGPEEAETLAQGAVEAMHDPEVAEGQAVPISISIGVSLFPANGNDVMHLLRSADVALYRAKDLGRSCCSMASIAAESRSSERAHIERLLRRAIERGENFDVHYQPQFTPGGQLTGFEALARLRDLDGSMISPARFIPVAEQAGLIGQIDQLVMGIACRRMARWSRIAPGIRMALNASPSELGHNAYAENTLALMCHAGITPRELQIELTESTAIGGGRQCISNLENLRREGVSIALDDFGTGYSSLSRLHQLPVDTVKIDKSFVGLSKKPVTDTLPLIEAVVAAARAFRLQVVAEGVETEAQLRMVANAGCDLVQGFYLGQPLPAAEAEALLETRSAGARTWVAPQAIWNPAPGPLM